MISFDRKFVFVHIPKTGGTSIRVALTPYCDGLIGPKRLANRISRKLAKRPIFRPLELPLEGHASALEYQNFLGDEVFQQFFKFAIVRNPFDLHVSMYEYMRQTNYHKHHDLVTKMNFLEFSYWRCHENPITQLDFVGDNQKCINVDFIGKFENLENDFKKITRHFGIKTQLPFLNASKRVHWRDYYTYESINLVRKNFYEDFEFFEYNNSIE